MSDELKKEVGNGLFQMELFLSETKQEFEYIGLIWGNLK